MTIVIDSQIRDEVERIRQIYCTDVLQKKNRQVGLLGRKCSPQVLYTFLGFELKMGRKRVHCPDVTSARYLQIFAEVGMHSARIPYDPSHTALLLPGLEHALNRIKALLLEMDLDRRQHMRAVRRVYGRIRRELDCED